MGLKRKVTGKREDRREKPNREEVYQQIVRTQTMFTKASWDGDFKPELMKLWQIIWLLLAALIFTHPVWGLSVLGYYLVVVRWLNPKVSARYRRWKEESRAARPGNDRQK